MKKRTELYRQIKSSDYPAQTVMEFELNTPCSSIFINNKGDKAVELSFKSVVASAYNNPVTVDANSHGDILFEIHKIKQIKAETELGHDFKIETYI